MMQNKIFVVHPEATTELLWNILLVWVRENGCKSFDGRYLRRQAGSIGDWTGLTLKQVLSVRVELFHLATSQCLMEAMNLDYRRIPTEPTTALEKQFGGKEALKQALWLIMAHRVCHKDIALNDNAMNAECSKLKTSLRGQGLESNLDLVDDMVKLLIRQAAS